MRTCILVVVWQTTAVTCSTVAWNDTCYAMRTPFVNVPEHSAVEQVFVELCFPAGDAGPKRVEANLAMENLVPGRTVYVNAVTILDEYDVVRIEYQEIPPKEPFPDGPADADDPAWAAWLARNGWSTYPSDDVGTEYDDWGGAEGLTPDGTATDGEFDFHPAPPVAARWLEIAFHGSDRPNKDDDARYTLRLTLPLDTTPINQG